MAISTPSCYDGVIAQSSKQKPRATKGGNMWSATIAHWLARLALVIAAAGTVGSAAAAPAQPTICITSISGTVDALLVPSGATCIATDLVVLGDVTVESAGSLRAESQFRVGGDVKVKSAGSLVITARIIEIDGSLIGNHAATFVISPEPLIGRAASIGGNVTVTSAETVSLVSLTIAGTVAVRHSGAEGLFVGFNEIGGDLIAVNNTVLGEEHLSLFAMNQNEVEGNVLVIANDATGAFEPPQLIGNIIEGNLICQSNTPELVNDHPSVGVLPNVVAGNKIGQCADL
jgi:hypothetical protein